ncbi:hypothetical protein ACJIZ3_008354 [Penstemon smallii]|uniref:RING-type E3 ubiquitin transferase n=1 Tax=Penstemon smallii TaxID=265156 RepID=A0ABD3TAK1_9LAMI
MSKKYVCQKCKVAIDREPFAGNSSNNFQCPRCLFMDSLPIIKSSKEAGACSICLEDFNSKTTTTTTTVINELPCRHHFHKECISEWISRRKYSCPLCRYKLPIDDAVRPARHVVENGHGTYIPPSDDRTVLLRTPRGYYMTWPSRTTTPQVVLITRRQRRRRTPQVVTRSTTAPPQVRTTTSGGGMTTTTTMTTTTSDHNNTTTILQDEDGDTVMLDNTILQDEDGDTFMLDAA